MTAGTVVLRNQIILSQSKIRREIADSTVSIACPNNVSVSDFQLESEEFKEFKPIDAFFWMVVSKEVEVELVDADDNTFTMNIAEGMTLTTALKSIKVTNLEESIVYIKAMYS